MTKHDQTDKIRDYVWFAVFVLFVWFDSLRPSQQYFSYVGTGLPGMNQTMLGLMCLAQWHDAVTPERLETVALWSRVRSVWIQNAVKANALEQGLAGDQIGPGTGPDILAKRTAATHWVATTLAIIKKLL